MKFLELLNEVIDSDNVREQLAELLGAVSAELNAETETRIMGAKIQALKVVRDWLKAAVTGKVFAPGNNPLMGHLLIGDGTKRTVFDYIREKQGLPALEEGSQIVVERE